MFISYDLESKGYRIHWPKKKTISVKHDLVFNKNDINSNNSSITIPGDALDEGERDKIIHSPNPVPLSVKLADGLELDHNLNQIMFKEKLNGEGKIETYQIWIIAGGQGVLATKGPVWSTSGR